jgi:hypothetical protein
MENHGYNIVLPKRINRGARKKNFLQLHIPYALIKKHCI